MDFTHLFCKIVGPVLLVRSLSIVIDRQHFLDMMEGVEQEIKTISFSLFPIALMMVCIAIVVTQKDTSSLAGILILLMAWGGIAKSTALMLFPSVVAAKVQLLRKGGFLYVVLCMSFLVGGYFTWYGYFAPAS